MGLIGKFIDRLCDERPDLAEQLLAREIGSLGQTFDNRSCGCVVGTVALAAGFEPFADDIDYNADGRFAHDWLGETLEWDPDWIDRVSLHVFYIASRIANGPAWRRHVRFSEHGDVSVMDLPPGPSRRAELIAIHLVRQRIAVRLATQTKAGAA